MTHDSHGTRDEIDQSNRRPLKVRSASWTAPTTAVLCRWGVTPNQISLTSIVFAGLAALCLFLLPSAEGAGRWSLPLLAAIGIQCRLLCNLFDGLVAVEGGLGTPAGELFNDIPDRIADPLILVAAGYATTVVPWATEIGWTAGLGAVMTAYIRTLAASIGAPVNFCGPMAKQHRMAIMTAACVGTTVEAGFTVQGWSLLVALCIVAGGCVITVARRSRAAYRSLERPSDA